MSTRYGNSHKSVTLLGIRIPLICLGTVSLVSLLCLENGCGIAVGHFMIWRLPLTIFQILITRFAYTNVVVKVFVMVTTYLPHWATWNKKILMLVRIFACGDSFKLVLSSLELSIWIDCFNIVVISDWLGFTCFTGNLDHAIYLDQQH